MTGLTISVSTFSRESQNYGTSSDTVHPFDIDAKKTKKVPASSYLP